MTGATSPKPTWFTFLLLIFWVPIYAVSNLYGQASGQRPKILRIAHVAFYVSDLGRARWFYGSFLGFDEAFTVKGSDGTDHIAFIKVNDDQYVELFAEERRNDGNLSHIALATDDALLMRQYLISRGASVLDDVHKGKAGNYFFTVVDPAGHLIEIVQEAPGNWFAQNRGRFVPPGRIANRITHVTISARSAGDAMHFYKDILGFREVSRGGSADNQESWIGLRVPDGEDYVELSMHQDPQPEDQGAQNYFCLERADIAAAVLVLQSRAGNTYQRPIVIQIGKEHRRRTSLFDPDGARIDLMEPTITEDKKAMFSSAPPPH
jgi:lactoylglutathione lyase